MSEGWSPQQREWLQAMGLQVFALAGDEPVIVERAVIDPVVADASAVGSERAAPPAATRGPSVSRPSGSRPSPAPTGAASPRPATGDVGQPPLLRALLAAARRDAGDPDFARAVPDVDALRGNAAAKRAAWPRLRALRRAGRA